MKNLPLELEIQNLADAKAKSLIYTRPLRATSYQLIWVSEGEAIFDIDFNEVQIRVLDKGGDPKLELVYEGEPYTLYGLENVDKFNQEISKTNEYLGDFSNNIARNLSPISHQQLQEPKTSMPIGITPLLMS